LSNFLAIATVTAALQEVLQPAVGNAVPLAKVGFSRPDGGSSGAPLVNVYLYQVTPNAAYRNADLPTRRSDSTLASRPQTALDLHYLFTFHGNDDQLEPQRLLGAVATTLPACHSQGDDGPWLPRQFQSRRSSRTRQVHSDIAKPRRVFQALVRLLSDRVHALGGVPGVGRAARKRRRPR